MSPTKRLKSEWIWIAAVVFVLLSLLLVWWFWYSVEMMRALSQVRWEQGTLSVDGVVISNSTLAAREEENHGRWNFWAKKTADPTDVAIASCVWDTYQERDTRIPFRIPMLYHQAVAAITRKIGHQPEVYRWSDKEKWGRLSSVWQLETQYLEVRVGHNQIFDTISLLIIPGRLDWDAKLQPIWQISLDHRLAGEQEVAEFLATLPDR